MNNRLILALVLIVTMLASACAAAPNYLSSPLSAPSVASRSDGKATETDARFRLNDQGGSEAQVGRASDRAETSGNRAASGGASAQAPAAPLEAAGRAARAPQSPPTQSASPASLVDESATRLPIVQNLGRMIIYNTDLVVVVRDVDGLPYRVGTIALAHGGYVAGVETKEENGVPTVVLRVKVAPADYEAAMQSIRGLAVEVREEKAGTQDVTEEHNDVATQIASLEATHAQLLRLMERAGTIEEVLRVQQQAAEVKGRTDRLKGRLVAMERLAELATITVKAHLASAILPRDYTTARAALRRAEATQTNLEMQLRRARTVDEQVALRDKIGETALEMSRLQGRVTDLEVKAGAAQVLLPFGDIDINLATADETLPREYIDTRVALRRAQLSQSELTRALRDGDPQVDPKEMTELILRINQLDARLREVQERARLAGVNLPTLTAEQEALLVGIPPAAPTGFRLPPLMRSAWEASLAALTAIASGIIFLWWLVPAALLALVLLRRRRQATVAQPAGEV